MNHNGIEITFVESQARFEATVGGRLLTAPSVDAMKKKIAKTESFKPVPVLVSDWYPDKKQTIVGLKVKPRGYKAGVIQLLLSNGTLRDSAKLDCKKNEELQAELDKFDDETNRLDTIRRKERVKISDKLIFVTPENIHEYQK